MVQYVEAAGREAKIAELKRVITAGTYETLDKLEDAVDAFLWGESDHGHGLMADSAPGKPHPR